MTEARFIGHQVTRKKQKATKRGTLNGQTSIVGFPWKKTLNRVRAVQKMGASGGLKNEIL